MTLRRLVKIVEIDAEDTACGACEYLCPNFKREKSYCTQFEAVWSDSRRLPQCLAAEQREPQAITRDQ